MGHAPHIPEFGATLVVASRLFEIDRAADTRVHLLVVVQADVEGSLGDALLDRLFVVLVCLGHVDVDTVPLLIALGHAGERETLQVGIAGLGLGQSDISSKALGWSSGEGVRCTARL